MHAPGKDDNISLLLATFVFASKMHILLSIPNHVHPVCCDHLKQFFSYDLYRLYVYIL